MSAPAPGPRAPHARSKAALWWADVLLALLLASLAAFLFGCAVFSTTLFLSPAAAPTAGHLAGLAAGPLVFATVLVALRGRGILARKAKAPPR